MHDDEFKKTIKPRIKLNHNKYNATTNEDAKGRERAERNSAAQFAVLSLAWENGQHFAMPTGFPVKWRPRNERRNSKLIPDASLPRSG